MARANAVDAHEEVGQGVDQRRPLNRQSAPVPSKAQLGQRAELCVGGQAARRSACGSEPGGAIPATATAMI